MNNQIVIKKAERKRVKLRLGVSGPAGSGKTTAALLIAYGMTNDWDKICVIDTENESAALYAGLKVGDVTIGEFPHIALSAPYTPERYIAAIRAAEESGAEVIILDSATHEWDGSGGCLEIVDKLGGRFTDWKDVTPRHRRFIDSMLQSSAHTIVTMRTKQEFAQEEKDGKKKVVKLGMKEVQREGFEYELTLNLSVEINHMTKASKDRTGLFMDRPGFLITPDTGRELREWNESGKEPPKDYTLVKRRIMTEAQRLGLDPKNANFRTIISQMTQVDCATNDENLEPALQALMKIETPKVEQTERSQAAESAPAKPSKSQAIISYGNRIRSASAEELATVEAEMALDDVDETVRKTVLGLVESRKEELKNANG